MAKSRMFCIMYVCIQNPIAVLPGEFCYAVMEEGQPYDEEKFDSFGVPNTVSLSHNSMSLFAHSSLPSIHKECNSHIQVSCKGRKRTVFVFRTPPSLIALQRCVRS